MKKTVLAAIVVSLFSVGEGFSRDVKPFVIVTVTPTGPIVDPKDNPQLQLQQPSDEQRTITDALAAAEAKGGDVKKLVDLVGGAKALKDFPPDVLDSLEAKIGEWTKPLTAADIDNNIAGYTALLNLRPDNATFAAKLEKYKATKAEQRKSVLKRFKKKVDEFNGVTWYTHVNIPKYTDIRNYIELYIGQQDPSYVFLRFKINYTSTKWLFIQSAEANIDGQFVTIPSSEWNRDNDTEIWEWMDVLASGQYLDLAKRIADSKKTVIRFSGQQYFDDYIVKKEDKDAIHDALLAYDVLRGVQN